MHLLGFVGFKLEGYFYISYNEYECLLLLSLPFCPGYLEAELVHGVDLIQIVHDKVEKRSPDSNRTVVFSGFVYLHLIYFSFQDLRRRHGVR